MQETLIRFLNMEDPPEESIATLSSILGFPWCLKRKEPACNATDLRSIPGLGRSPGGGHSNPLRYSCLENPMDRGVWPATIHGVARSQMGLSDEAQHSTWSGIVVIQAPEHQGANMF